ncbi:MAG TPA: PD-(D/E)XK nuclease family protein [Candidatus Sulfomarinibacteraceae bacterium]|nr:PD-(D/E)XK nuclease family protein [Candidatus Sulfomarinibacteraceae bacterium]
MSPVSHFRSRVITCRGARAAERCLLEQLDAVRATAPEDLSLPVRVVVPSKSLRRHLLRRMVDELGGAAGVVVQTLHGLAHEILDNAGLAAPRGDAGFDVLVRRLARGERALRSALEAFDDGYDAVAGAVRDLLDAGFEPALEEGVLDKLDNLAGVVARSRLTRARALVRLAARTHRAADELALWRLAHAAERAEEALATDEGLLPARALFVHGFADVTGVAADLLRAVLRSSGGVVIVDRPPDPADPAREDPGTVFLDRLLQGLSHLEQVADDRRPAAAPLRLLEAPDPESELRWVGERVVELLGAGCEPEDVAVVARGLESAGPVIRRHFRRLGIPFSGVGATVAGPFRRLHRLADVLARGADSEVDLWSEAWGGGEGRAELLLGLRTLGVLRVADAAVLETERHPRSGVRLPVALRDDDGDGVEGPTGRLLPAAVLTEAAHRARRFVDTVAAWPQVATAAAHREHTGIVLRTLGWTPASDDWDEVEGCLADLEDQLTPSFAVERGEWLGLVGDVLRTRAVVPVGGAGGGVQVLTVMEARARTFRHLFLVSVNRGIFPRVLADDAMLPEALRARLATDVLPHIPVRARSADEERYLFAQLLSAADSVHVSWHLADGDAKLSPSPFVDRLGLGLGRGSPDLQRAAGLWQVDGGNDRRRPAWEHAVVAAVRTRGVGIEPLLEAAVTEGGAAAATGDGAAVLAAARTAVVAAVEAPGGAAPGPWSGYVGGGAGVTGETPWVTGFESFATCPWRTFVNRRLGVQPLTDPQLELPDPGSRLLGLVVHRVLETIVDDAVGARAGALTEAAARPPVDVRWPGGDRFEELLLESAHRVAREEGLAAFGLGPLLAARARPFIEVARRLEWGERGLLQGVLASEVTGEATAAGVAAPLAFRADRVGREDGTTVLVDYKTSAPWTKVKKPELQRRDVLLKVARGRGLQAVAYALAPAGGGVGRYLFLKPVIDGEEDTRTVSLASDDPEAVRLFTDAVAAVAEARLLGVVFPRVEEADSDDVPAHCRYCAVAEACLRDDSRFRRRLVDLMAGSGEEGSPAEAAARRLWWLGVEREEGP